ncbi:pirin family protein [Steroidobacter sp.]|uniref:pirin family protein n=1 Tax=Steroidobacter sp. TaxID=1978227 RepID=UPI001A625B6D|nr:pirin family protein [Steroidobacter sp.]MBL8268122.1 pirin family protein [Steroidobacter sp.]
MNAINPLASTTSSQPAEPRRVARLVQSLSTLEGGGFPVRRPFPVQGFSHFDPFLLIDHLGPVDWPAGGPIGAPDHPHRGFETVTYVLAGENEHRDSFGNADVLRPGDVQWMTAGGGVIHSEMPTDRFHREGGVQEGFQIWVNLPAVDKMMTPRYQTLRASDIPQATTADGRVHVRIIAGESLGKSARIDTRVPIQMLHFTVQPGGELLQSVPAEQSGLLYVFKGAAIIGSDEREVAEGQAALLGSGDSVKLSVAADAAGPAEILLLSGKPLNEPVARYGPFVMNTREEIEQAFRDYQSGRFGLIPPRT